MNVTRGLKAPASYRKATERMVLELTNGCGARNGLKVPNTMWGLLIIEACRIHDWEYTFGETLQAKIEADKNFKFNLNYLIVQRGGVFMYPRMVRANTYYLFVKYRGGEAYWKGKANCPPEHLEQSPIETPDEYNWPEGN